MADVGRIVKKQEADTRSCKTSKGRGKVDIHFSAKKDVVPYIS